MRIHLRIFTLIGCIFAAASCARSQANPPAQPTPAETAAARAAAWEDDPRNPKNFHSCTVSAGGGYPFLVGKDGDNFRGRWNFQAGVGIGFTQKRKRAGRTLSFFLNFDYLFAHVHVNTSTLQEAQRLNPTNIPLLNATDGTANVQVVAVDPTLRIAAWRTAEAYVFGGFGYLRRHVTLAGPSAQGALIQPGNPAEFLRNSSSGAVDGGAGINFLKRKGRPNLYAEVRVVHGLAVNHSTTLIPVSFGIRW